MKIVKKKWVNNYYHQFTKIEIINLTVKLGSIYWKKSKKNLRILLFDHFILFWVLLKKNSQNFLDFCLRDQTEEASLSI